MPYQEPAGKLSVYFKAIKPTKWDLREVLNAQTDYLQSLSLQVLQLYKGTTLTWRRKPTFSIRRRLTKYTARIDVYTNDENYIRVDGGTGARIIVPKRDVNSNGRPTALRFQKYYKAKTSPGKLKSRAGGAYGPVVYRHGVIQQAPAIKPRGFSILIQQKAQKALENKIAKATELGIRRGLVP